MVERTVQKIKCVIVDDEEPAHEVLQFFIEKIPWLEYAGSSYNVIDATGLIADTVPGLVFLDINMPELSGIELLKLIKVNKVSVVLTTAYPEYAVEGFKYDVTSFLLKPIDFESFFKVATKVRSIHALQNKISGNSNPSDPDLQYSTPEDGYIWIKAGKKLLCLRFREIMAIQGLGDYVKIYCNEEMIISRSSLAAIFERLTSARFIRTHRSFIVNRDAIKQIDGKIITLLNDVKLPISSKNERDEIIHKLIT